MSGSCYSTNTAIDNLVQSSGPQSCIFKAARWHARPVYKSSLPATIVEHRGNLPVGVRTDNLSALPEPAPGNATSRSQKSLGVPRLSRVRELHYFEDAKLSRN